MAFFSRSSTNLPVQKSFKFYIFARGKCQQHTTVRTFKSGYASKPQNYSTKTKAKTKDFKSPEETNILKDPLDGATVHTISAPGSGAATVHTISDTGSGGATVHTISEPGSGGATVHRISESGSGSGNYQFQALKVHDLPNDIPRTPEDIIKKLTRGQTASAIYFANSSIETNCSSSLSNGHIHHDVICTPMPSTSLANDPDLINLNSSSRESSNPAQNWPADFYSFKTQFYPSDSPPSSNKHPHLDSNGHVKNKHKSKSTNNKKKFQQVPESRKVENRNENSNSELQPDVKHESFNKSNKFTKTETGSDGFQKQFQKKDKKPEQSFVKKTLPINTSDIAVKPEKLEESLQVGKEVETPEMLNESFQVLKEKDKKFMKRRNILEGVKVSSKFPTKNNKNLEKEQDKEEDQEILKKFSSERLQKLEDEFNANLLSSVEAWLFCGQTHKAHFLVKWYLHTEFSREDYYYYKANNIKDIKIYNALLHGWAKVGNLAKIQDVFSFMRESKVTPTLQSYAAVIECMGRSKAMRLEIAQKLLTDIKNSGYDIKDIFNKCLFVKDERFHIKKALKSIDPHFVPHPVPKNTPYVGPLIEKLNEPLNPEQVVEKNPYFGVIKARDIIKKIPEQIEKEKKFFVTVKSVLASKNPNEHTIYMRERIQDLKQEWKKHLIETYMKKLKEIEKNEKQTMIGVAFLKLFKPPVYADIILDEVVKLASESEYYSPSKHSLHRRFGSRVFNRYKFVDKQKNGVITTMQKLYKTYAHVYTSENPDTCNHRVAWQRICNQDQVGSSLNLPEKQLSFFAQKQIGSFLFDVMVTALQVDSRMFDNSNEQRLVPAFYSIYRNRGYQLTEEVKPHPVLAKLYRNAKIDEIPFEVSELPMLVPPIPWNSVRHGGYFTNLTSFVRYVEGYKTQKEVLDKLQTAEVQPVLDSLNILGACPWIVNTTILDIIIDVFSKKGNKVLDIPQHPSEAPPPPKLNKNMDPKERYQVIKAKMSNRQLLGEMYSLWCSELYRLSIANEFRDKIFWFPHNIDFRGRTYPCPTHLNHLGSDVTRSLLLFAKGKPLGENGLNWLKIHLINLTGFKKRSSNADRLKYADEMMDEILDSADNPMTGRLWWQDSDEPWQTLACCIEIAKAIRSPNPKEYICHLPTHQDGSCNGLQHYAALGRDQAGAESVNLSRFETPKDVYSDVAELVEKERIKDAANGLKTAQILKGFVARKVIKQTVMTTVYGVTRYGARKQIMGQLKDNDKFPEEHVFDACRYLTDKTFDCLQEMFSSTKEIQDWFTRCAELVSKIGKQPVGWVTPLGLPVIQPYQKFQSLKFQPQTEKQENNSQRKSFNVKPDVIKQKNAFPPNYIHSLDSVHMMLTSLYCLRAGITFISVHDCFWTHPCDIDIMNKICREQFVALHSQPLLEQLSKDFIKKYRVTPKKGERLEENQLFLNNVLRRVPKRGSFDISNVLDSTYFFS